MPGPTPEQWQNLNSAMAARVQFFHAVHRRLQSLGLRPDDNYMLVLDKARQSLGSLMIHTFYATCGRGGGRFEQDQTEQWLGDGI